MTDLKLGLIGDNIARSRSPLLHRLAGIQNGMAVEYDRLIPRDMGEDFDTVFDLAISRGYRGINVTYPYKERAAAKVAIELCADLGRDAGRHVERMGNSGLMLNPSYIKGMEEYLKGVGGKK